MQKLQQLRILCGEGDRSRNTREYLNQIQRYEKIIHNKYIEREQLRSHATGLKSFCYESERVQTSGSHDMIGDLVAKIVDLETEIISITNEYMDKRMEIIRLIDSVESPVLYEILFKKYIEGKPLDVIADEIGYSYQRTKELHLCAIETVKELGRFDS